MWEVAELSGNFHGELSLLDRGERVIPVSCCRKKQGNTRGRVTSEQNAITVENRETLVRE